MTQLVLGYVDPATPQSFLNAIQAAIATANAQIQANPSLFPGNGNITINISPTDPSTNQPAGYAGFKYQGQVYLNPAAPVPLGEFGGVLGHELSHIRFPNNVSNPTTVASEGQLLGLHDYVDSNLNPQLGPFRASELQQELSWEQKMQTFTRGLGLQPESKVGTIINNLTRALQQKGIGQPSLGTNGAPPPGSPNIPLTGTGGLYDLPVGGNTGGGAQGPSQLNAPPGNDNPGINGSVGTDSNNEGNQSGSSFGPNGEVDWSPGTDGDPNVENPAPSPSSPQIAPGLGPTPNENGASALTSENLPANIANANAQASEADLPAESAPDDFPVDGAQPVGFIEPSAFQTATFDPSANNNFQDAVQQAVDSIDATNAVVAQYVTQLQQQQQQQQDQDQDQDQDSGSGSFAGSGSFGGSGGGSPVVLDVASLLHQPDHGIKITPLSSSNKFFDMTGSGCQNLTAWAGAGNGVLFFDPTGQGQLTQEKQIEFTAWDPGAKSDMQALEDVFDTNHDGSLDAGDADFNDFFVMVTNPDGTETAYSLAQLGITSINLNANAAYATSGV